MSDRIEALEQTVEQLVDAVEELSEENQELREELEEYRTHNEKDKAMIRQDVTEVREQNGEPTEPDEPAPEDPPIYDVIKTPEDRLSANERRTAFFWKDLKQYTTKAPAGRVVTSSELKTILRAGEPEESDTRIESKTIQRVMKLSKKLTRGAVSVEKREGRWMMVIPKGWQEQARRAYQETARSDTAVSTG